MLVLSRKEGEKIHIGDNIVVEVRRVSGNRVTLAIKAPGHVRILRGELTEDGLRIIADDESAQEAISQ